MAELELVCVPTRILTDNDDIVDAIVEFGGHKYWTRRTSYA